MSRHVFIVDQPDRWADLLPDESRVTPRDYLTGNGTAERGLRVINLCREYGYLSTGYYCSLLAEARGQRVLPTARTVLELNRRMLLALDTTELDETADKALRAHSGDKVELELYFGETDLPGLGDLGRRIFEAFPCPLLTVSLRRSDRWRLFKVAAGDCGHLDRAGRERLAEALGRHMTRRSRTRQRVRSRWDLAILHDPGDPQPPSDRKALKNLIRVGRSMGLHVDLIERDDFGRLAEYDALFIRATTRIDHYTFRFAKRAEAEGIVVIDDPDSILRCTNKVFLAELLKAHRVPTPKTRILSRSQLQELAEAFGFPVVLKIPDGSFSKGVYKADDATALKSLADQVFRDSDLILAQEFLYTDFDWRIGVLAGEPIYACKYFMSKRHWQIVNYTSSGEAKEGGYQSVALAEVPPAVTKAALRAARLIGDGLYGVDVKHSGERVAVIEVNDNPNLEAGVEDAHLGDELYRIILAEFTRRLERDRGP